MICDAKKVDTKGCLGAPDIVVEILSPGNNVAELKNKYIIYEEAGVKEYWVVSPQDHTFSVYTLKDGNYISARPLVAGDVLTSTILADFSLDVAELFAGK